MKLKYGKAVAGLVAALCVATTAYAAEEAAPAEAAAQAPGIKLGSWIPGTFTGSITATSDYSFRGISQTQTDFAMQGGLLWHPYMGIYLGGWASGVNFGKADDSYMEQDWLLGYAGTVGDFGYDVSATYLWYPKESDYNYWEFAGKGTYNTGPVILKLGVMWSPDYFNYAGNAGYFSTGFTAPLPIPENPYVTVSLDGNAGYTVCEDNLFGSDNAYWDWNVGLVVGVSEHITVDLRYVDTDTGAVNAASDARFVGGATFSF